MMAAGVVLKTGGHGRLENAAAEAGTVVPACGSGGPGGQSTRMVSAAEHAVEEFANRNVALGEDVSQQKRKRTSKHNGVFFASVQQKWVSKIRTADGRQKWLGSFLNEEDAARAFDKALNAELAQNPNR